APVVLFLHGFPELWYSWRHQILALSSLGYRAVAPDLRGFGDTDAPSPFFLWLMIGVL
ncbi:epoxide hydrolase, partial [Trifolium pratense]